MSLSKDDKKIYRQKLKAYKETYMKGMIQGRIGEMNPADVRSGSLSWNAMDLMATAIMMEEAMTLSKLTRVLICLTTILSILTGVLAYSAIIGIR